MIRWVAQKSHFQELTTRPRCVAALRTPSTLVRSLVERSSTCDSSLTGCSAGLFAPRAGQNFRDEQRRRRSQYDRGTRLAEIEDSFRLSHQFRGPEPGYGYRAGPQAHPFRYIGQHAY